MIQTREPARGQRLFAIVTPVDPARTAALERTLATLESAVVEGDGHPFAAIDSLHFASFTIFPDPHFGPYLVFENNVDGTPEAYIERICGDPALAPVLRAVYAFGRRDDASCATSAELRTLLRRHVVPPAAAFVGNVGRSVERIRAEAELVAHVHAFLDRSAAVNAGATPAAIVERIRTHLRGDPRWDWVWQPRACLSARERVARWGAAVAGAAGGVALLVSGWLPLTLVLGELRRRERTDPVHIPGPPAGHVRALLGRENRTVQNHMASLCYVKPGAFRRRLLTVVLFVSNLVARISTGGTLLRLDSLHFAHWSLIDDGARLLFLTNYDGSWENYLDDFIEKAAAGLTAIWSNTINFPRTVLLLWGGARDERKFKAVARTTQAFTNVWYSAYPSLPVTVIQNNTAICAGLAREPARLDAAAWLRRFD